jgi:L-threonylcarbamoyladenylate synthase
MQQAPSTAPGAPSLLSNPRLRQLVDVLAAGGVVACPTEAVWGLSCDPYNDAAVQHLLELKQRPVDKGLILVAADAAQLAPLLDPLPDALRSKVLLSWPGPNTWLLPHHGLVSPLVHGAHDTVAVRVSGHAGMRALCALWGGPLVSSSANVAGRQPPRQRFQVRRYFGDRLDGIAPGAVGRTPRPSTIRDVFSDQVIRA